LSPSTDAIEALVADLQSAPDERWRETFRRGFDRLRAQLPLHPAGTSASATFEAAARIARSVAARNLPLGLSLVMHLYPLCALRCVPLPWWTRANVRRSRLLQSIYGRSLILANAGSERRAGAHAPVTLRKTRDGIRVDGTYDYVSLADVADLVLFCAPLAGGGCSMFCAAELRSATTRIGASRFDGSMKLSDTCSVTFVEQVIPPERFLVVPSDSALTCMAQYQRSWFHLLIGESYRARIEQLRRQWDLPPSVEDLASLGELDHLRDYALHLLEQTSSGAPASALQSLSRLTAAMKLRISLHAQSTAAALLPRDAIAARELGFLKLQPTSDDRIVRGLMAARDDSEPASGRWALPHGSYAV
jgi:hypothetical protein